MKITIFFALIIPCFILEMGCQTQKQSTTVLERSSEVRPLWVSGQYKGFEGNKEYLLHYSSRNIQRLELGIRQTQLEGMGKIQELFESRYRKDVASLFDSFSGKEKNLSAKEEVMSIINQVLAQSKVAEASPKSVYWEKIALENTTGGKLDIAFEYTITVLLVLPRSEYNGALAQLSGALENAIQPAAKKFGQWINQFVK